MDLGDFPGTLRWKYGGGRIRYGVALTFKLGSFLLKCSHFMPHNCPFESEVIGAMKKNIDFSKYDFRTLKLIWIF